jgi:hypothetical protein
LAVKVVLFPKQIVVVLVVKVTVGTKLFTVTVAFTLLLQVPTVTVYVTVAVPGARAVINPDELIETILILLLDQTPPKVLEDKVEVAPKQRVVIPVIGDTTGFPLEITVTEFEVYVAVSQPVASGVTKQLTTSLICKFGLEYVIALVPTFTPFTFH